MQDGWHISQGTNATIFVNNDNAKASLVTTFNVSSAKMAEIHDHVSVLFLDYDTCNSTVYADYLSWNIDSSSILPHEGSYSTFDVYLGFFFGNITDSGIAKYNEGSPTNTELSFCMRTDLMTNHSFFRRDLAQRSFTRDMVKNSVSYVKMLYNITLEMSSDFTVTNIKKVSMSELDELNTIHEAPPDGPVSLDGYGLLSCQCDAATRDCYWFDKPALTIGDTLSHCVSLTGNSTGVFIGGLRQYIVNVGIMSMNFVQEDSTITNPLLSIEGRGTRDITINLKLASIFFVAGSGRVSITGDILMQFGQNRQLVKYEDVVDARSLSTNGRFALEVELLMPDEKIASMQETSSSFVINTFPTAFFMVYALSICVI